MKSLKPTELYTVVDFLHKEACDNYNENLPHRDQDTYYYEGKKNAYRELLDIILGKDESIDEIRQRIKDKK